MFTSEEISKAREIAAKATPRPWRAGFLHDIRRGGTRHELHEYDVVALAHSCLVKNMAETFALVEADIAYLELACNEYPAALDEIERLRKALESLRRTEHYECDDCWYSCHKHPDCCCDQRDDGVCTCGMDRQNAIIAAALKGGE